MHALGIPSGCDLDKLAWVVGTDSVCWIGFGYDLEELWVRSGGLDTLFGTRVNLGYESEVLQQFGTRSKSLQTWIRELGTAREDILNIILGTIWIYAPCVLY